MSTTSLKTFIKNYLRKIYYYKQTLQLNTYEKFSKNERELCFLKLLKYLVNNRPMTGNYFEFGSHSGRTFRCALKYFGNQSFFNRTNNTKFYAFDSFEGLPKTIENDEQEIWGEGKFKTSLENFKKILRKDGYENENYELVKGFYHDTLTKNLKKRLLTEGHAAIVYIDCDLYYSTVPVLNFIKDFLKDGSLIVFDDWYLFNNRKDKGQQKAWYEFLEKNPDITATSFFSNAEIKVFIINK